MGRWADGGRTDGQTDKRSDGREIRSLGPLLPTDVFFQSGLPRVNLHEPSTNDGLVGQLHTFVRDRCHMHPHFGEFARKYRLGVPNRSTERINTHARKHDLHKIKHISIREQPVAINPTRGKQQNQKKLLGSRLRHSLLPCESKGREQF